MVQGPLALNTAVDAAGVRKPLEVDAGGNLKVIIESEAPIETTQLTALYVTAAQQLKVGAGVVHSVNNLNSTNLGALTTTALAALTGTSVGALYDAVATTGIAALTTTQIAALGTTQLMAMVPQITPHFTLDFTFKNGLVVVPGNLGQVLSLDYE